MDENEVLKKSDEAIKILLLTIKNAVSSIVKDTPYAFDDEKDTVAITINGALEPKKVIQVILEIREDSENGNN